VREKEAQSQPRVNEPGSESSKPGSQQSDQNLDRRGSLKRDSTEMENGSALDIQHGEDKAVFEETSEQVVLLPKRRRTGDFE